MANVLRLHSYYISCAARRANFALWLRQRPLFVRVCTIRVLSPSERGRFLAREQNSQRLAAQDSRMTGRRFCVFPLAASTALFVRACTIRVLSPSERGRFLAREQNSQRLAAQDSRMTGRRFCVFPLAASTAPFRPGLYHKSTIPVRAGPFPCQRTKFAAPRRTGFPDDGQAFLRFPSGCVNGPFSSGSVP